MFFYWAQIGQSAIQSSEIKSYIEIDSPLMCWSICIFIFICICISICICNCLCICTNVHDEKQEGDCRWKQCIGPFVIHNFANTQTHTTRFNPITFFINCNKIIISSLSLSSCPSSGRRPLGRVRCPYICNCIQLCLYSYLYIFV